MPRRHSVHSSSCADDDTSIEAWDPEYHSKKSKIQETLKNRQVESEYYPTKKYRKPTQTKPYQDTQGFYFKSRREKLNWRLFMQIDIDKLMDDVSCVITLSF